MTLGGGGCENKGAGGEARHTVEKNMDHILLRQEPHKAGKKPHHIKLPNLFQAISLANWLNRYYPCFQGNFHMI